MRVIFAYASVLVLLTAVAVQAAPASEESSHHDGTLQLTRRGGCSGGVHVCCGSTSVGCSGNVCKACCGNSCGCFYTRGSKCSSDPNVTPCVDVAKPDFAMTNGKCVAPRGGIVGGGGGSSSGGSSGSGSSFCSRLPASFKGLFGC